jgi:hypothetical protein
VAAAGGRKSSCCCEAAPVATADDEPTESGGGVAAERSLEVGSCGSDSSSIPSCWEVCFLRFGSTVTYEV